MRGGAIIFIMHHHQHEKRRRKILAAGLAAGLLVLLAGLAGFTGLVVGLFFLLRVLTKKSNDESEFLSAGEAFINLITHFSYYLYNLSRR